jgi:rhamnosyltransferase
MKRLLLYVHYNKAESLSDHVVYQLEQIHKLYDSVLFISNSELTQEHSLRINNISSAVSILQRGNAGFDFGAWRDGINHIGWNRLQDYDSVTLMNDTNFGPLFPLEPVYRRMEGKQVDFWGMHALSARIDGMPGRETDPIPAHVQSFFAVYNRPAIMSDAFRTFWDGVVDYDNVFDVIQHYETQLTQILAAAGMCYDVAFAEAKTTAKQDPTLSSADKLIEEGYPFLKVKAFQWFKDPFSLVDVIRAETNYPTALFENHFTNVRLEPRAEIVMFNKILPDLDNKNVSSSLSIAIHLHVHYIDIFKKYIEHFSILPFDFDLYITTNTDEKVDQIDAILQESSLGTKTEVILTENKGRDIIPWLAVSEKLEKYDLVGKFHTKKSEGTDAIAGKTWQEDLWQALVRHSENIIKNFEVNDQLGIVIPDVPRHFRFVPVAATDELIFRPVVKDVWQRMQLPEYDFDKEVVFLFAYGTMFWYRPSALKPLTSLVFSPNEIPEEPLKQNVTTILHALERLPVYVSYSQGYTFGIAQNRYSISSFIDNRTYNERMMVELFNEHLNTAQAVSEKYERSLSYRLGQFLLKPLRFLRRH